MRGIKIMKRVLVLLLAALLVFALSACGSSHCKECDREVYKDGYCEYHYALNTAGDIVNDALGSLFG